MSRLHLVILGTLLVLWTAITVAWLWITHQVGFVPEDHSLWSYVQLAFRKLPSDAEEALALFENQSEAFLQYGRERHQITGARYDLKFVLYPPLIGYGLILCLLVPFRFRRASL